MADAEIKMSDLEKGNEETGFNDAADESTTFLPEDANKCNVDEEHRADEFYGLSREELEKYASDPKWVKVRWILLGVFIACWTLMLVAAIVIVVLEPPCPKIQDLKWYQSDAMYKISVENFKDSDGDGLGDVNGIVSKQDYFETLDIKTIWLTGDFVSRTDLKSPNYGSLDDFSQMTDKFKKKGIRAVVNLDLTAVSDANSLFTKSAAGEEGYEDVIVWKDSGINAGDGYEWQASSTGRQYLAKNGLAVPNAKSGALVSLIDDVVRSWASAGAEGFVLTLPTNADEDNYAAYITRQQELLDEEFNKRDDRARIIVLGVGGLDLGENVTVGASIYSPSSNCSTSTECNRKHLDMIATANDASPWKMVEIDGLGDDEVVASLVQKMTVPGTPLITYGDEIGLAGSLDGRGTMLWDDSPGHGFSDMDSVPAESQKGDSSVLAQSASGYSGVSYYNLFKRLVEVRGEENSLKWGEMKMVDFGEGVVAYVRHAEGFPPIVVAMNTGEEDGMAGSLAYGTYTQAEVLVASGVSLDEGAAIDAKAIYLPYRSAVVLRLSEPEEE